MKKAPVLWTMSRLFEIVQVLGLTIISGIVFNFGRGDCLLTEVVYLE